MITVDNFREEPEGGSSGPLSSYSALRALLYVPLMATNVLATVLICYKAWCVSRARYWWPVVEHLMCRAYRKDISSFTTDSSNNVTSASDYKPRFRVDRILALFIETGALYIVLMV